MYTGHTRVESPRSPAHAVSRHIAPLRDRRSPVAATPQANQISEPTSSTTGKVRPPSLTHPTSSPPPLPSGAARAPAPRLRRHSKLNISANPPKFRKLPPPAWSCRSQLQLSGQQHSSKPHHRPQSPRIALPSASHTTSSTSKRPARSRRRPFGIP